MKIQTAAANDGQAARASSAAKEFKTSPAARRVPACVGAVASVVFSLCSVAAPAATAEPKWPSVGDRAPNFQLIGLNGEPRRLSDVAKQGPVVLVILRGFPGYQCPICTRQVGEFIDAADEIRDNGATVVMIYPGPAEELGQRAEEFTTGIQLPEGFHLLLDPDYQFVDAYNLRWEAPRETAYPAAFVVDQDRTVTFSKVSRRHGGRASANEVVEALEKMKRPSTVDESEGDASLAATVLERLRRHTFHPVEDGFTKDADLGHHGIADLANEDWRIRTLAIRDLARIGSPAIPSLLAALEDDDFHVRQVSALVLGILPMNGSFAQTLRSRLRGLEERLAMDPESIVRSEAAIALGRIGDDDSANVLETSREQDSSRDVRHQCTLALDRIGKIGADDSVFDAYEALDEPSFNTVQVGQTAIDFTLRDTEGRVWKLSDFHGKKHVVLIWIFADWCPVCHGEFHELVQMRDDFSENDVEVATIECHDRYRSRVMVGKELLPQYWFAKDSPQAGYQNSIWWSHLADPAGAVGATYGVQPLAFAVHSEYINRPSTIIIDKDGIVRFAYYGTYWGDRPSIEQTLEMIEEGRYEFEHSERLEAARGQR